MQWRSLRDGNAPPDGARVFYTKGHFSGVMTYTASFGVQWYLDRDYDLWCAGA